MPSGRPTGPRRVEVPEGYLTVREAAVRLGLSPNMLRKLMIRGSLPWLAGPRQAKGIIRFIPVAAVEGYVRPTRGRRPGTPNAQPRRKVERQPSAPWQPRQKVEASNGHRPPAPAPRQVQAPRLTPDPAKLWATLARLEAHKREIWDELRAGASAAVRDEWFLLLRRLLFAELALLEEVFEEPKAEKPDKTVQWFGDEGEDVDDA